jgi:cold shock CspA family protein
MARGRVRRFDYVLQYGAITPDEGAHDVLFGASEIQMDGEETGWKDLEVGTRVSFVLQYEPVGGAPHAIMVTPLEEGVPGPPGLVWRIAGVIGWLVLAALFGFSLYAAVQAFGS